MSQRSIWLLATIAIAGAAFTFLLVSGPFARTEIASIEAFGRTGDPRKIVVSATIGLGDELLTPSVHVPARTPVERLRPAECAA